MSKEFPEISRLDYTEGVIDGLKWCLNCGLVASAEEIVAQIKKLQKLQDDALSQMEKDFEQPDEELSVNDTYDIIVAQILETFPDASDIVKCGVFHDRAVVKFAPYKGSSPYTACLFKDAEKIVVSIVV